MGKASPVYIVGAGPGDPELLTVKALRLLEAAEVVVYDRLVSAEILARVPAGVGRIFAGKAAGDHPMPQAEINDLLVKLARSGRRVVRLKGGDPFVFARGGEEAAHLAESGVPFEVVPGITAAAGCGACAGIPLTHRGLARGVHFVTGHCRDGGRLELDWKALADAESTVVVYMGLKTVGEISRQMIAAGRPADTPAAAIENGTTPAQRTILTTLAELPSRVAAAGFGPPTLLIIGRVVELAAVLNWYAPQARGDEESHG